jgi:predicted nucleotide-binding protein (sugar kinase/HSP70/actin superfamily)
MKPFSKELRELFGWKVEAVFKHHIEGKIKKILSSSGLVPSSPHDMKSIIDIADEHFVTSDLYSEISISSGVAAKAMMEDYSGVINISPFACLIGRVIEGLYTPWARERKYPVMSVEIDGEILPPNIVRKLEIFMLNVLRFRKGGEIELVEETGGKDFSLRRADADAPGYSAGFIKKEYVGSVNAALSLEDEDPASGKM